MDSEEVDYYARRVIRGDFGNGQERRDCLGGNYNKIQNRVNQMLGYSKRHYPW